MPTSNFQQIRLLLIHIHILNDKQCRSRSVGFFRSQLIWIYTVCKGRAYPGSARPGLITTLQYIDDTDWTLTDILIRWGFFIPYDSKAPFRLIRQLQLWGINYILPIEHLCHIVRKHTFWYVRPTKTQIVMRTRVVWSVRCPHEETVHSGISKMRPVKILIVRKRTFWYVRPTKTQIVMRTRVVWSVRCPHEETLHSGISKMRPVKILIRLRMRSLIRIIAGRTCLKVRFLMLGLIWF